MLHTFIQATVTLQELKETLELDPVLSQSLCLYPEQVASADPRRTGSIFKNKTEGVLLEQILCGTWPLCSHLQHLACMCLGHGSKGPPRYCEVEAVLQRSGLLARDI